MTKHHWRHQVKSFFEKHVDQDKHEQLKETRKDMEDKKEKIIHLIKGEEQDGSNGKSESLEKLVKDYHKQYESLYELYHNLTGEMKKKVRGRNEEDKEKFSSSSSDSEFEVDHSSEGKGVKNGELPNDLMVGAARWDQTRLQLMSENDELKVKLESSTNLEIELNQRVEELAREKSILIEEKDGAIKRAEEAEANVVELKDTVDGMKNEMKALEEQETALKLQLDMANNHKRETEEQLEIKAREAEVSNEEASRLKAEISQLKATLKDREEEHSIVLKKVEDIEKESGSKTEALKAQINGLEKEAEMLRAQKSELEEQLINKSGETSDQMKEVFDQLNGFQKELMTLATLKAEMESELERKSQEVSECLTQIGNLTEKLGNSKADQKRILEEKSSLAHLAQSLESEVESLIDEKRTLGDKIRTITTETAGLKQRITELEGLVSEKENMCAKLESKIQDGDNEASAQIEALTGEIDRLKEELEAIQTGKTVTSQLENENAELRSQVIDLELNLRSEERKAKELSRGNESNDQLLIELQTTIEDLKRDIEMDKDELMTIEEKNRNLEVMLRLSNQKLRVTEQLLSEKEVSHNLLEEKAAALSQTLEAYSDMIREISEQANASLAALERAITKKFDEDYGGLAKRLLSLSEEVRSVKSWVVETRLEKEEMVMETEKVKAEGVLMRERIEKLEMEATKEKVEKEEVVRMLSQLDKDVKEKEERLLGLGEEKREAIKQLCVGIEYHRSRCVELRGILLKMAPKVQRTS